MDFTPGQVIVYLIAMGIWGLIGAALEQDPTNPILQAAFTIWGLICFILGLPFWPDQIPV